MLEVTVQSQIVQETTYTSNAKSKEQDVPMVDV